MYFLLILVTAIFAIFMIFLKSYESKSKKTSRLYTKDSNFTPWKPILLHNYL